MGDNGFTLPLKPLEPESISSTVVDLIMNYLLSGDLKPGDKLPTEHEFAKQLGVGRNSIREAIKMLSSIGVVKVKRGPPQPARCARRLSTLALLRPKSRPQIL